MKLNAQQQHIVDRPIDAVTNVLAGAGTGKTRVLVERYTKFVVEDGISPDQILALTFTLKAADEMRERIRERLGQLNVGGFENSWVMNFHTFGYQVLRDNAPGFGLDPATTLVSPVEESRIRARVERQFLAGKLEGLPAYEDRPLPGPGKLGGKFETYTKVATTLREQGLSNDWLLGTVRNEDLPDYRAELQTITAVRTGIEAGMRHLGRIDFADMIALVVAAFREDTGLRDSYASRFRHILVDEFQDTSDLQAELIRQLCGGDYHHVTVVGDEKQSIYRWRAARVENIQQFPGERLPINTNYRSRQNILDVAHGTMVADEAFAEDAHLHQLQAATEESSRPIVFFHPNEAEVEAEVEADAVAAWVAHLTLGAPLPEGYDPVRAHADPLVPFDDVAILVRKVLNNPLLAALGESMKRYGLPYAVVSGTNSVESEALALVADLLTLLVPGEHVDSLLNVLNYEPFWIPDAALKELFDAAKDRYSIDETVSAHPDVALQMDMFGGQSLPKRVRKSWNPRMVAVDGFLTEDSIARVQDEASRARLRELITTIRFLRERLLRVDFRRFVVEVVEHGWLAQMLVSGGATVGAVGDVCRELLEMVDTLQAANDENVVSLIDTIATSLSGKLVGMESDMRMPPDRVRVMTVHQAKGLEFRAVAVTNFGRMAGERDGFFFSPEYGLFISKADGGRDRKSAPDYEHEKIMEDREERHTMYVALTRAEQYLMVSSLHADGMAKAYPSSKQLSPTLFTDALGSARAGQTHSVEWREAPTVAAIASEVGTAVPDRSGGDWPQAVAARMSDRLLPDLPASVSPDRLFASVDDPRRAFTNDEDEPSSRGESVGISVPAGVSPDEYGTLLHGLLERALIGEGLAAAGPAWVERVTRDLLPGNAELAAVARAAAMHVNKVAESPLGEVHADLQTELAVQARGDNVVLSGVVDRLEKVNGRHRIVDYKVARPRPGYEFQVAAYARVISQATGEPCDGILAYIRDDGVQLVEVDMDAWLPKVDEAMKALEVFLAG